MRPKGKAPFIRNEQATRLNDAIEQMFSAYKLKGKAEQATIITLWGEIMGKTIASRTTKLFFKGKVLYVELSSAPLKQELTLAKERIMALLVEKVGAGAIEDIVFR